MSHTAKQGLASSLLASAETVIKGDSDVALSLQWGLASAQFKLLTGMSLTEFYLKEDPWLS